MNAFEDPIWGGTVFVTNPERRDVNETRFAGFRHHSNIKNSPENRAIWEAARTQHPDWVRLEEARYGYPNDWRSLEDSFGVFIKDGIVLDYDHEDGAYVMVRLTQEDAA